MQPLSFLLLSCLVLVPILIAWRRGDRILDALAAVRRRRLSFLRRRSTQSLPVQEDALKALLQAEQRVDDIEERISQALARFRSLGPAAAAPDMGAELEAAERQLLARESAFGSYLDIAWLQSEAIAVLSAEVEDLRELAGVRAELLKSPPVPQALAGGAADRLMRNLTAARQRRTDLDRRIHQIRQAPRGFDTTVS